MSGKKSDTQSEKQSEKQKLIAEIIALQKKFIRKQQTSGVSVQEYYLPDAGDALSGYHEEHAKLAARLVDLAHQEQGTSR